MKVKLYNQTFINKLFFIILVGCLFNSCGSTNLPKKEIKYFDENNVEISKSKFQSLNASTKFLEIPGDAINHKKLTVREKNGTITDRALLIALIEQETDANIDPDKPLVIIYNPGKKRLTINNSWFEQLEDGLNQIAQIKPIYLYTENKGLEKYDDVMTWNKDPKSTIERLFFKHYYAN